jgi:hypothetical protein
MSLPPQFDHKSVLIDKLGDDSEDFIISNTYLPKSGPKAIYEIQWLEEDLLDVARDPTIKDNDLGPLRPKEPNLEGLSPEEQEEKILSYRKLMREYNLAVTSIRMQVPIPDMFTIDKFMKKFWKAIKATPAVKGRRFHALTKNVEEPQGGGIFGLGKKGPPS